MYDSSSGAPLYNESCTMLQLDVLYDRWESQIVFRPRDRDNLATLPLSPPLTRTTEAPEGIVPFFVYLCQGADVDDDSDDEEEQERHAPPRPNFLPMLTDVLLCPTELAAETRLVDYEDSLHGHLAGVHVFLRNRGRALLTRHGKRRIPLLVLDSLVMDLNTMFRSSIPPVWPLRWSECHCNYYPENSQLLALYRRLQTAYKDVQARSTLPQACFSSGRSVDALDSRLLQVPAYVDLQPSSAAPQAEAKSSPRALVSEPTARPSRFQESCTIA
jgi:hypothetical protein